MTPCLPSWRRSCTSTGMIWNDTDGPIGLARWISPTPSIFFGAEPPRQHYDLNSTPHRRMDILAACVRGQLERSSTNFARIEKRVTSAFLLYRPVLPEAAPRSSERIRLNSAARNGRITSWAMRSPGANSATVLRRGNRRRSRQRKPLLRGQPAAARTRRRNNGEGEAVPIMAV